MTFFHKICYFTPFPLFWIFLSCGKNLIAGVSKTHICIQLHPQHPGFKISILDHGYTTEVRQWYKKKILKKVSVSKTKLHLHCGFQIHIFM